MLYDTSRSSRENEVTFFPSVTKNVTEEMLQFSFIDKGGTSRPKNCIAREKLAVIIPYANRKQHLLTLLYNLLPYLHRQQRDFRVFVVEPVGNKEFNKAKLMNIGAVETRKFGEWSCLNFHDVDVIPLDDRNIYNCHRQPLHLMGSLDRYKNGHLPYPALFGGASAIRTDHFHQMNGFSNYYWGWGGEDDDASNRIALINKAIMRRTGHLSSYTTIEHERDAANQPHGCNRKILAQTSNLWKTDGLNSLNYKLLKTVENSFWTHIYVDILEEESKSQIPDSLWKYKECLKRNLTGMMQ